MKHFAKAIILLTLALALLLTQAACAEPDAVVKGVYDALTADGSDYTANKAIYAEYYPEMAYEETLLDDGFTVTVTGNEYMDGSWTFTREGDYLTAEVSGDDINGMMMVIEVARAVGEYYGMDPSLVSGYINGLSALGIENDTFIMEQDEAAGTVSFRINIAGPWEMKELDQMVLDENVMYFEPLTGDHNSMASSIGKVMMVANGNADALTILLGEYGELDELAYRSLINAVSVLQPKGWEDFTAGYTELADAEAEGYTVTLNVDEAAVAEIIEDAKASYSYAIIRFGAADAGESADAGEGAENEFTPPAPMEAPSAEMFAGRYFDVIAALQPGRAGASLETAAAASAVCAFAEERELYNPDVEPMRANMLAAFEAMDAEKQTAFWEGFEAVRALLDDSLEDYEANRPIFEDAGVAEAMDEIMYDPLNRLAWEKLRDHTLTMGNDAV